MLLVIRQSNRDERTEIHTGHQDFSEATSVVDRINTAATSTATRTDHTDALLLADRQLKHAPTRFAVNL
jgi:hypothetical protein